MGQGRPLGFVLTGGGVSDYKAVPALLDMPVPKPKALLADKGYDGDTVRENLLCRGILPVVPPEANRREAACLRFPALPGSQSRRAPVQPPEAILRIATRYDKTATSFLGFLSLAATKLWLNNYVNRA